MHTEKREDPLVELGYEVRDLNTVAIRNATIGFFIFAIASALIGFVAYRLMNPTVFDEKAPGKRILPAANYPMLQSNIGAKVDIEEIRQHETAVLNAPVGWADKEQTHLHVPIDEAIAIVAKNGIKATGSEVPAVTKGHTPDPAIGEKASVPAKMTSAAASSKNSTPSTPASTASAKTAVSAGAKPKVK
jgi:hypothetical protein